MSKPLGSFRGKPIDENMSKHELLEVIKHVSGMYSAERKYNQKIEKYLPIDWQYRATKEQDNE